MAVTQNVNVQYKTIAATVVGVIIANVAVALRLLARRVARITLKVDDYLMMVALLFHWSIAIGGIILLCHGLGLPLSATSMDSLVVFFKTQYAGTFLYTLTVAFTKGSILFMYWRVFPCKEVRILVQIGFAVVGVWAIATCVTGALICIPVQKMWMPQIEGACLDIAQFYYGIQIPNILTDIYIILVPIHEVYKLDLPKVQKLSLVCIFGLAVLTVIFDIIRLVAMVELSQSTEEVTVAIANATVWTCVEPAVGILAACLSNMRPLYKWAVQKWHTEREETSSGNTTLCAPPNSKNELTNFTSTTMSTLSTRMYASSEVEANVLSNGPFAYEKSSMNDIAEE